MYVVMLLYGSVNIFDSHIEWSQACDLLLYCTSLFTVWMRKKTCSSGAWCYCLSCDDTCMLV